MREASATCVDEYMATVHDWMRATLQEAQAQSMAEVQWQKWYYDQRIGAMDLKPGDLVLVKADAFKWNRKIRDMWEDEVCEVVLQMMTDIPSYEVMDQCRQSCIFHWNRLLLVVSEVGIPLCVGVCHAWDRCTSPTSVKPMFEGSESRITPWQHGGLAVTQHPVRKTSLGFINGKLWLPPWMTARASTDDRWRFQVMCSRCECLLDHIHLAEGMILLPIDAIR